MKTEYSVNGLDIIRIDGTEYTVENWYDLGFKANIVHVSTMEGPEFYLAEDSDEAGTAARERWADMAANDPAEFRCIVGDDVLLSWATGQADGPGSDKSARNLQEWLDIVAEHPDEEFGSYDGTEIDDVSVSDDLAEEIGFRPTVAYRHN